MRVRFVTERGGWALPPDTVAAPVQSMDGDVAVITQGTFDPSAEVAVDSGMTRWLEDAPLLGRSDSSIENRARAIVQDERDPREVARRLVAWVSQNIGRRPDPVVPRAATVLREGQADVDGHTLLFVALARAAGLPARTVSGTRALEQVLGSALGIGGQGRHGADRRPCQRRPVPVWLSFLRSISSIL